MLPLILGSALSIGACTAEPSVRSSPELGRWAAIGNVAQARLAEERCSSSPVASLTAAIDVGIFWHVSGLVCPDSVGLRACHVELANSDYRKNRLIDRELAKHNLKLFRERLAAMSTCSPDQLSQP